MLVARVRRIAHKFRQPTVVESVNVPEDGILTAAVQAMFIDQAHGP